ncbi:MAG: methyltransferase small domain protein [Micavibrio sp.]|nr:methyltransferase small domain protein [Micavibrio sp.]
MPEEIFVLDKKVLLLQPEGGFRTSLDSVMVAAACPAKPGDRILDLGCGVGGASFCLAYRVNNLFITGIDIQPEYIDLARQNAAINNDTNRCEFFMGNIRTFRFPLMDQRVEQVLCNPPFLEAGTYTPSPDQGRATALGHEGQETELTDWIDCAFHALRNGGTLTMIHRADAVDKIVQGLGKRFGQTTIIPLYPREGQAAKRVIVRTKKDSHAPAILHPGIILHNADGTYTAAAEKILRGGHALF